MIIDRIFIAKEYLSGNGIEIGALHNPLAVPENAHVTYLDRMPNIELRKQYPELDTANFVDIGIIDDGEKLATIADNSLDFVIANHFLEHCENPLGAIYNMLRVLCSQGILYMAIPDKRFTFDVNRPVTNLKHCINDYRFGPGWFRNQHFKEWAQYVNKIRGKKQIAAQVKHLVKMNYSIHFHAWTQTEVLELVIYIKSKLNLNVECELICNNRPLAEVIVILRKTG